MSDTITLSRSELDQMVREAVIQAVAAVATPAEDAAPVSNRALPALDLSNSTKVAKSKIGKSTAKYWGDAGPHSPASFRMRKRIAAFADLKTGGTAASDRIFRGPLTRAQATTASTVLESGRSIRLDDLEIDPK